MAKPKRNQQKTVAKAAQAAQDQRKAKAIAEQKAAPAKVIQMTAKATGESLAKLASEVSEGLVTPSVTAKGMDIDLTVKGAMQIAAAPDGTKRADRRFVVDAATTETITRLYESNSIGAEIAKLKRESLELQWKLASFCVAIAGRLQRDKEEAMPILHEFMNAISGLGKGHTMIRTNAFRTWFEKYSPVSWQKPQSGGEATFMFDAKKHRTQSSEFGQNVGKYFERRASHTYWMVAPERDFKSFDFDKNFNTLIQQATKIAAMSEEDLEKEYGPKEKRQVKLGKFENIMTILKALRSDDQKLNADPIDVTASKVEDDKTSVETVKAA